MGVLRLLLALSVVVDHTYPLPLVSSPGGDVAVEAFFVISGFYMSLVLTGKYAAIEPAWSRLRAFAVARCLRLFPIYGVVLVLMALAEIVVVHRNGSSVWPWASFGDSLSPLSALLLVLTNLWIVGQDVITWTVIDPANGGLDLSRSGAGSGELSGYSFLLVPQAWSLSLELCFYTLAPFLVRRSTVLIGALTTASLFLRLAMPALGLGNSLWSYRFFPAELGFFLLGVLAQRFYRTHRYQLKPLWGWAALGMLTVATVRYGHPSGMKQAIYLAAVVVAVPLLFATLRNSKVDRAIGDLSYPVYICHLLVLLTVQNLPHGPQGRTATALVTILGSVVIAQTLLSVVDRPVERVRQERYSRELKVSRETAGEPQALP